MLAKERLNICKKLGERLRNFMKTKARVNGNRMAIL
jgi:hypothetical protein